MIRLKENSKQSFAPYKGGKQVRDGFSYYRGNDTGWLTIDELKK